MAHVLKRRDQEAVRWYVLTLPTAGGGRDRISPSKGLDAELSRRERRGEALFEYFSPSYVEARKVGGKMVNTKRPLLYNYVFVHASEDEIFRLKRTLPLYNFLPRVSSGGRSYFPYLSDREMDTLRWVAASYSNELPVYVPSLDCLWVPLFEVRAGEYELIELNTGGKHVYTHLDNDRLSEGLHGALGRYHASGVVVDEDARLAREVLRGYASLRAETDVIRCKLYSLLLPAYLLLGESDEFDRLRSTMRSMLPVIKAGQSRALLLVTLYGCTDSSLYQRMAHELVGPWMEEASPKRSKSVLIRRLRDYDRWFGHGNGDE